MISFTLLCSISSFTLLSLTLLSFKLLSFTLLSSISSFTLLSSIFGFTLLSLILLSFTFLSYKTIKKSPPAPPPDLPQPQIPRARLEKTYGRGPSPNYITSIYKNGNNTTRARLSPQALSDQAQKIRDREEPEDSTDRDILVILPKYSFERTMIMEAYIPFSVILRAFAEYMFDRERFVATMRALIVATTLHKVSVS